LSIADCRLSLLIVDCLLAGESQVLPFNQQSAINNQQSAISTRVSASLEAA
jgi:hypothetical protein